MEALNISLFLALGTGVLSFASPCVLPLVPAYLSHLRGQVVTAEGDIPSRRTTFLRGLFFVLGFSAIFVALGYVLTTAANSPLPLVLSFAEACVILVDDDQDNPDVRTYYISALDELGVTYDVWDVATQGDPAASDLMGYEMVIWFTGYPRNDTFTSANEAAMATYLDADGRFCLVSEDYLYDRGLTTFGQSRLRIGSYTGDVNRMDPVGNVGHPVGGGLGPYNLTAPDGWLGDLHTDDVNNGGG